MPSVWEYPLATSLALCLVIVPSAPLFMKYSLLSIDKVNVFQTCLFMFKFKNCKQDIPFSFHNFFQVTSDIHSYPTRQRDDFNLPLCRTSKHQRFIKFRGPQLWSSLDTSLKSSLSVPIFKKQLKRWIWDCVPC